MLEFIITIKSLSHPEYLKPNGYIGIRLLDKIKSKFPEIDLKQIRPHIYEKNYVQMLLSVNQAVKIPLFEETCRQIILISDAVIDFLFFERIQVSRCVDVKSGNDEEIISVAWELDSGSFMFLWRLTGYGNEINLNKDEIKELLSKYRSSNA